VPKERRETVHGPYKRKNRWRLVITAANDRRCTESFASEAEALERKASFQREIEQRTIAAAVEAYLAAQERRMIEGELRPSTLERIRYHLRSMLKLATKGHLDMRKLTPAYAERLYDDRTGAVDTHRNGLSVAKAFGAWCVKRGWLRVNPFADVIGRGRRRKGKPQLRVEESRKVIDTCAERLDHDDGAVCTLAYLLLSTRNSEIVPGRVRDVDDGGRLLWVPDSKTQAGRRQIEVPAVLQRGLLRLATDRPANAPLFVHAATRGRPQDWAREQVWRICKLAGVPEVGPHGLRGTHATIADSAGATPELVAATLGHASTGITTGGAYIDRQQAAAAGRRRAWRVLDGGLP
jgi:integrase/recombinase XerC